MCLSSGSSNKYLLVYVTDLEIHTSVMNKTIMKQIITSQKIASEMPIPQSLGK